MSVPGLGLDQSGAGYYDEVGERMSVIAHLSNAALLTFSPRLAVISG